jgi:hypothetical protein
VARELVKVLAHTLVLVQLLQAQAQPVQLALAQPEQLAQKPVHSKTADHLLPVPMMVLSQKQERQPVLSFYRPKPEKSGWKS